jgi:hypothetical protein
MSFFEKIGLNHGHDNDQNHHEDPYWKLPIHEGFHHVEGDWHGNALYRKHFSDGTLPGFSEEFKITDQDIDHGMLENCATFPVKIRRASPGEYWVYVYRDTEAFNEDIEGWILTYKHDRGNAA